MPCSCCATGYSVVFDEKLARKNARSYRRKGLDKSSARLVEFLRRRGVAGDSVLEVGGGVGAIELELLKAGATRATNVELSPEYEPFARELADESGFADRLEFRVGDLAADDVEPADDVVLHRVVCCYPDVDALVGAAARRARRRLVLSYPPDNAVARVVVAVSNFWLRIRGIDFRSYVWSIPAIVAAAEREGMRLVEEESATLAWRYAAFER